MNIKPQLPINNKYRPLLVLLIIALIFIAGYPIFFGKKEVPKHWITNLETLALTIDNQKEDTQLYLELIEKHKTEIAQKWTTHSQKINDWNALKEKIAFSINDIKNDKTPLPSNFEDLLTEYNNTIDSIKAHCKSSEREIFDSILKKKDALITQLNKKVKSLEKVSAKKTEVIESLIAKIESLEGEIGNLKSTIEKLVISKNIQVKELENAINKSVQGEMALTETKQHFTKLKEEEQRLHKKIKQLNTKISHYMTTTCKLATTSFTAQYWIKENKKRGKLITLDKSHKHSRKLVRKVEIEFLVCEDMKDTAKGIDLLIELSDAAGNIIRNTNLRGIDIKNNKATTIFSFNKKLKKGSYFFLVSRKGLPLFEYEFRLS